MQEKSRMKAPMGAGGTPKRFRGSNLSVSGAEGSILNAAPPSRKLATKVKVLADDAKITNP